MSIDTPATPLLDRTTSVTADLMDPRRRWTSVGHSMHPDPVAAVDQAIVCLDLAATPELLLVFVAPSMDSAAVAELIAAAVPGVPMIGCTTAGEVSSAGQSDGSLIIMALGGDGFRCATASADIVDGDIRTAAANAAGCVADVDQLASTVLVLLLDGSAGDQGDVVRGAYDTVGPAIPLVGGCGGGIDGQLGTRLLHDGTSAGSRVVAAVITSEAPIGIGVAHGWRQVGEPMVVTSSELCTVRTLDEAPALDVYLARHDASPDLADDPEAFDLFAMSRPLGVARRERTEARSIIGADPVRRTLHTGASVPQGGIAWFMEGDERSALAAVDVACDEALGSLGDLQARGLLVFDCGSRRGVLGPMGIVAEIDRVLDRTRCPAAGLYTYGEVARVSGSNGFHNQTLVLLALA